MSNYNRGNKYCLTFKDEKWDTLLSALHNAKLGSKSIFLLSSCLDNTPVTVFLPPALVSNQLTPNRDVICVEIVGVMHTLEHNTAVRLFCWQLPMFDSASHVHHLFLPVLRKLLSNTCNIANEQIKSFHKPIVEPFSSLVIKSPVSTPPLTKDQSSELHERSWFE